MEIKKVLSICLISIVSCQYQDEHRFYTSQIGSSEFSIIPKEEVSNIKLNIYKYKDTLYLGSDYFQKRIDEKLEFKIINEKKV